MTQDIDEDLLFQQYDDAGAPTNLLLIRILNELRYLNEPMRIRVREMRQQQRDASFKRRQSLWRAWDALPLPMRIRNAMVRAEKTPDEVRRMSDVELMLNIRNIGSKSLAALRAVLPFEPEP